MPIITLPLVPQIVDGQVIDAVPVMTLFNSIAAQINSGAQPIGGVATSEFNAGTTPTFISSTSLSLIGNQTAIYQPGRVIQTTNTGGTVYSVITTSVFTTITTLTLFNLYGGVLDAGLSAINYSFQNGAFFSKPPGTLIFATAGSPGAMTTNVGQTQFGTGSGVVVSNDSLSEFNTTSGTWSPKYAGIYRFTGNAYVTNSGVTFGGGNASITFFKNGVSGPGNAGVITASAAGNGNNGFTTTDFIAPTVIGDAWTFQVQVGFTGGAPTVNKVEITIQRLA